MNDKALLTLKALAFGAALAGAEKVVDVLFAGGELSWRVAIGAFVGGALLYLKVPHNAAKVQ